MRTRTFYNNVVRSLRRQRVTVRLSGAVPPVVIRASSAPKMTQDEAIKLLCAGPAGIAEWNRRREEGAEIPSLSPFDLSGEDLRPVDFRSADLRNANLAGARLKGADFRSANLSGAILQDARVMGTDFNSANLAGVSLRRANLRNANLRGASLRGADLTDSFLKNTSLTDAKLTDACFSGTMLLGTVFGDNDLSTVRGLDEVVFLGPCFVSNSTLGRSRGRIPDSFLQGCALKPWEVVNAKMYDQDLTALQIADLQAEAFRLRTEGPIFFGGVFISYAREDSAFVDKIRDKLKEAGAPVWVDRFDAPAGPVQRITVDAVRVHDVVLLILSKASVESNWVEHEIEVARKKEKDEKRDVLCPVALDDAWKDKMNDVLWRQLKKKNILDFSKWKTKAFGPQFDKLLKGLKIYYQKPKDS